MTTLTIPTFTQQVVERNNTNKVWYFFWQGLWKGTPPGPEMGVSLAVSPMTFTANQRGFMVVSGGTVSDISLSRDGTTFYSTGMISGPFPLSNGDTIKITFSADPVLTYFPQ